MAGHAVKTVNGFQGLLQEMLQKAEAVKPTDTVEPPLNKPDLGDLFEHVDRVFPLPSSPEVKKRSQYAAIETAVLNAFNDLLANTKIDTPGFAKLWHLLDIISILSDDEQCDPALLFWLVEGLLDSQTIAGCRKIFDYLESRRDRITAKHFTQKQLVILRSCNELLRRLSRAEDTAFCGRVFIFLFQSFPLGDKSSVNLRGEFHTENVTAFDEIPLQTSSESMEVDSDNKISSSTLEVPTNGNKNPSTSNGGPNNLPSKPQLNADELYPIFWSLQQSFSEPKKLFDKVNFAKFKNGVAATTVAFKNAQDQSSGRPSKPTADVSAGSKRKRGEGEDDLANAFNPKYLTSRDLFELEISDLSFRRHILVQILIVIDFLLSLSPSAKEKLSQAPFPNNPNKSVMYADYTLSDEDVKWAQEMRTSTFNSLLSGLDGPHFHRMVESLLIRDKNWVRWKIENCPSIARPATTPKEFIDTRTAVKKVTTNKRLRTHPMGSLNLGFLSEKNSERGLNRLKERKKYEIPPILSFKSKIELDDMDIDMANDEETKNAATESKSSKCWRALRVASSSKLATFDKIERADKIDEIFSEKVEEPVATVEEPNADNDVLRPKDSRAVVISGPSGAGKSTLITQLMDKHPKALGRKVSHTTRQPRAGEVNGQHYHFVTKENYDIMRDGDQFLEHNNYNGNDYGTSKKVVEGIIAQGKVPIVEMEINGIGQTKESGFAARYIFIAPPSPVELERRLKLRGTETAVQIKERVEIAKMEFEAARREGVHDIVLVNERLEETFKKLEAYIFGNEESVDQPKEIEVDTVDGVVSEVDGISDKKPSVLM